MKSADLKAGTVVKLQDNRNATVLDDPTYGELYRLCQTCHGAESVPVHRIKCVKDTGEAIELTGPQNREKILYELGYGD